MASNVEISVQDVVVAHPQLDEWPWVSSLYGGGATRKISMDPNGTSTLEFSYPQVMPRYLLEVAKEFAIPVSLSSQPQYFLIFAPLGCCAEGPDLIPEKE